MKKALLFTLLFASFISFKAGSQVTQVGLIGEFNGWGADVVMTQDSQIPDLWTVSISFVPADAGGDNIVDTKFRANGAWDINWGAADFPTGIGTQNGANIPVLIDPTAPSTNYFVTFNSATGAYNFINLAVEANRGYNMTMNGNLGEPEYHLNNTVAKLVNGAYTMDRNSVQFAVAYDDDTLFVGLSVLDAIPTMLEMGEIFIDGNNSGGAYDASDLHLRFNGPQITIVQGPANLDVNLGFGLIAGGYAAELAIPFAAFGIVPTPGGEIGFDIIFGDSDDNTTVNYLLAWAGDISDYTSTDLFGTLTFSDQTGIGDKKMMSTSFNIYPNPAAENVYLQIDSNKSQEDVNVVVADVTGRIILNNNYQVSSSGELIQFDASRFTPGIYTVSIIDSEGNLSTRKLMISGK
jgi:hypothetical protein